MSESNALITREPSEVAVPVDLMNLESFGHMQRVASMYAASTIVPDAFKNSPANCCVALELSHRWSIPIIAVMQGLFLVKGKLALDAKMKTALINTSNKFTGELEYEIVGSNVEAEDYKVRCFAFKRSTGERVNGPWINWKVVKGEGWLNKDGSKWKTFPELMFAYRAASWFGNLHCGDRLMGIQTRDELEDMVTIEGEVVSGSNGLQALNNAVSQNEATASEDPNPNRKSYRKPKEQPAKAEVVVVADPEPQSDPTDYSEPESHPSSTEDMAIPSEKEMHAMFAKWPQQAKDKFQAFVKRSKSEGIVGAQLIRDAWVNVGANLQAEYEAMEAASNG